MWSWLIVIAENLHWFISTTMWLLLGTLLKFILYTYIWCVQCTRYMTYFDMQGKYQISRRIERDRFGPNKQTANIARSYSDVIMRSSGGITLTCLHHDDHVAPLTLMLTGDLPHTISAVIPSTTSYSWAILHRENSSPGRSPVNTRASGATLL